MRKSLNHIRLFLLALTLLFAAVFLSACSEGGEGGGVEGGNSPAPAVPLSSPETQTRFSLDTVISLTIYYEKDRKAAEEALDLVEEYEKVFSRTFPESELYRLNENAGKETKVSDDLFAVLKLAWNLSGKTDGAYDCTFGGVSALYAFGTDHAGVPDEDALSAALSHTGYEKVHLNSAKKTVLSDDPELVLDLGSIAKGYIADRMKEFLLDRGVTSALINLGGNVLLVGGKITPDQEFKIGIQDPDGDGGSYVKVLKERDLSVVTSGDYERCFEIDGVRYHHLLDPATGLPARSGLRSVTVVSKDSVTGDALSTACFVLGEEGAEALLAAYPDVTLYLIRDSGEIITLGKDAE